MTVIKTLQVNLVKIHPRPQVFEYLRGAVSVGNKSGDQSSRTCFLKDSHGPFAGDQRFVVRADDDPASLAQRIENKFCWCDPHQASNSGGIAQGLGGDPILAIGAVQITAEHSEAVGECSWISMKEGFFLDWIALDAADIAPRDIESSVSIEANLANSELLVGDLATMPARKTPHPLAVELFVQLARSMTPKMRRYSRLSSNDSW